MTDIKSNTEKITELELAIKENKEKLSQLKIQLHKILVNKNQLKAKEECMKEQINETQKSLEEYKLKSENIYSEKIAETEWLQTKMEINLASEKFNIEIQRKKMSTHIAAWLRIHSVVKEEPAAVSEAPISNTQWSSDSSGTITEKMVIEAQAAEISLKKSEYLENIDKEQNRYKILLNRNQAHILKLRKDLQRSEAQRKETMELCKQVTENIKKMKTQNY